MKLSKYIVLISTTVLLCNCKNEKKEVSETKSGYQLKPVNIQNVKVTDEFWLPIIKRVQEKTIEYAIAKCKEEGRLDNFLMAGGKMEGEVKAEMNLF